MAGKFAKVEVLRNSCKHYWVFITNSHEGLPTYAQALKDHADLPDPLEELETMVEYNETDRLY